VGTDQKIIKLNRTIRNREENMNKITIDKKYFDLNSSRAKGLISGLKKLSGKNFTIFSEGLKLDNSLKKILELENIPINNIAGRKTSKTFTIPFEKNFDEAVNDILVSMRSSRQKRKTKETDINLEVSLDGNSLTEINTGIGFFDHMLEQIAKHANINLKIDVKGDLDVDEHHTVEDVGITLGTALSEALGDKKGIKRFGFFLPMDDAEARCAIDLSGRNLLNFKCKFNREKVGDFPTELVEEFFRGISSGLKSNIIIRAKGKNDHHKIESIFKAFAKALNEACRLDERTEGVLPSTKGIL
jgi:imidazoleglycerol-phosphate dehydratase / histidinol-phosphatase